ncbi:peptidoglycan recognition protein family protein [Nocardioides acrostichi]|uniref:Peptidoglycan recognition protein n=1 Tax=Nocardioides acrostichi TaxID=2784339 RepID=A0A930Y5T2_9ACTN|nr:peptidoglycan recognition protein [Nocardioides acrostichi]MBF4160207.1 peptidoglycan recognition protein [Nocardioides acrostichi]
MSSPTNRRSLLKASALAAVAVGGVGAGIRLTHDQQDAEPSRGDVLTLSADDGSDVAALDVPIALRHRDGQVRSAALRTSTYSMLALTWRNADAHPHLEARAHRKSGWTDWVRLPELDDMPDEDAGRVVRQGTAAWWVGPSRSVQVRSVGPVPKDLHLVLLHPASREADAAFLSENHLDARPSSTDQPVSQPKIATRAQWGADESWRDGSPRYNSTIEQVHVHHTASGNDYSKSDVPGLIRAFYRYHTKSLGWSDIGYNFLVDRFGRIWEGRYGGVTRPVRGAHTLGFNNTSTGVSCIGNFDQVAPPKALLRSVASVAAWKLDMYHRRPRGKTTVRSEGSDKYAAGAMATLRVIDGHRDTNDTSCPGTLLYQKLPTIRSLTYAAMNGPAPAPQPVGVTKPAHLEGSAALGTMLKARRGTYDPQKVRTAYQWLRDGQPLRGETIWKHQCTQADLGHDLSVRVTTSAQGRSDTVQVLDAGRVKTEPVLDVVTHYHDRTGKLRVKVSVTSPQGIDRDPHGQVTVKAGNRSKTVPLAKLGKAVVLGGRRGLKPGVKIVHVSYTGDKAYQPATTQQRFAK